MAADNSISLRLFKRMADEVPAYRNFLQDHGIRSGSIRTQADLERVPTINKANYLRAYPYSDLFWGGSLRVPHIMTSTSGSTGEPFFFPRSLEIDRHSAIIHERFFLNSSLSKEKSTLVIDCFGMGVWIGGLITYQAFRHTAKAGNPIAVITPGIDLAEIGRILSQLASNYDQLILTGYPPFIKDVLDEAHDRGISLSNHRIALVFAAEAFTEAFRDQIVEMAEIKNPLTDTMNIYGTADLGTMAFETPLSILVRRLARNDSELFGAIFGEITKTPTLVQYIPEFITFEEQGGQLFVSGDSAIPLVRYDLGDRGGVRSFDTLVKRMREKGVDLREEMTSAHIDPVFAELPFVYVFERIDLSVKFYGANIYPEPIRETLLEDAFAPIITGRFFLATKFDECGDQYLGINIELKHEKKATDDISSQLRSAIVKNLSLKNSEYKNNLESLGTRSEPRLVFWPYEEPHYFRRDIKQRWVGKR